MSTIKTSKLRSLAGTGVSISAIAALINVMISSVCRPCFAVKIQNKLNPLPIPQAAQPIEVRLSFKLV